MPRPSSEGPRWTDHDVSDPGVTLLQAVVYSLSAVTMAVAVVLVRRRRRRRPHRPS